MIGSVDCFDNVLKSFNAFQNVCCDNKSEPIASWSIERLQKPMGELVNYAVAGIISEMKNHQNDSSVQTTGVHILRVVLRDNVYSKQLILGNNGVEVLVEAMKNHPSHERLLTEALEAIDEIHGLSALLDALFHLKYEKPGASAALWAFSKSSKRNWLDVQKLPAHELLQTLLIVINAHIGDPHVLQSGLSIISDVVFDHEKNRSIFADLGGWEWLFNILESNGERSWILLYGFKILAALGCGGARPDASLPRCVAILERAMCRHDQDACLMHWALLATGRLGGARALIAPMRNGSFWTATATVSALKCLGDIAFGQSDCAGIDDMPAIVDVAVSTIDAYLAYRDVLYEAAIVIGNATSFIVGGPHAANVPWHDENHMLAKSAHVSVNTLLQLLQSWLTDSQTAKVVCASLAQILDACDENSPVRASICKGLNSDIEGSSGRLLSKVMTANLSDARLQGTLTWLTVLVSGVPSVLVHMRENPASLSVQDSGVRALGLVYEDKIDLDTNDFEALVVALGLVKAAMARFRDSIIFQQHACYALGVMAEQSIPIRSKIGEDTFAQCIAAAAEALQLVRETYDGGDKSSSYNALYLKKEAARCIVSICGVWPSLGRWLHKRSSHEILADALRTTADGAWDNWRNKDVEDTLRLELLSLSYVLGPPTVIVEALRRWGPTKPAVVKAAAEAVVELVRNAMSLSRHLNIASIDQTDVALASIVLPVQALQAAGCAAEFLNALQAYATDEELVGHIHLALGFVGSPNS